MSGIEFKISRTFDAPRELVWKAFTEADRLLEWFSPKGFGRKSTNVDLRPGGVFHYCLVMPKGEEMWGKFVYQEIVEPEKLVYIVSFSDAEGGVTRHPLGPNWPLEVLTTIAFADNDGKTTITVTAVAHNPTAEEQRAFDEGQQSMKAGFTGTFDQLEEYLAESGK